MLGLCQRCSEGCVAEEPVLRLQWLVWPLSWVFCCIIVCWSRCCSLSLFRDCEPSWLCWAACAVLSDEGFQGLD